jgi:magnesium-transporting ATPase (P-type)
LAWQSVDESIKIPVDKINPSLTDTVHNLDDYDLCLTGGAIRIIQDLPIMSALLSKVWVYARVSPAHKVNNSIDNSNNNNNIDNNVC